MNKIDVQNVSEGDLITFQRRTKSRETVNQLGLVTRLNTVGDAEDTPTTSFEIYLLTEEKNKPNINKENGGLPEKATQKLGLDVKYRIYNVPLIIGIDAFEGGQAPIIGSFSSRLTEKIFNIIEKWEDEAADKLKFLPPSKLAGTGFMRFTPPPAERMAELIAQHAPKTAKSVIAQPKQQATLPEKVAAAASPLAEPTKKVEPEALRTEGQGTLITEGWGKAPNILIAEPGR